MAAHEWMKRPGNRVKCRRCRVTAVLTREGFLREDERTGWCKLLTCDQEVARSVMES